MHAMDFRAPPTVLDFLQSRAFVRAIVGPIGSGKSSGCVMELLRRAGEQAPLKDGVRRTRWAVIRNTRPQLQDTTRRTFEQWAPAEPMGTWNESDFSFTIRAKGIEAEVLFRALDKPKDVRKVLSLELTGAYINELREIPKEVFDGLQGRVGRYPSKAEGGCTWRGVWSDSNPWHTGHWAHKLFKYERPPGFELFEQPDALGPDAENVSNLDDGYYERLTHGKDSEWVDEYLRGKYPSSDKGSVYGELIAALEAEGLVCDFEHPLDGVFATFDLGVSDSTAIWFWRLTSEGDEPRLDLIDWYECSGKGADHYFQVLEDRGYKYAGIWLPHDARARTFQTGKSTLELFLKRFPGLVGITPELDVADGIGAGRWVLEGPMRVHTRCAMGLERLRAYRYQWDETKKVFSKKPLHDFSSHSADSYRYVACQVQASAAALRKPDKKPRRPAVAMQSNKIIIDDAHLFRRGGSRPGNNGRI
jgi:hypothetical protein